MIRFTVKEFTLEIDEPEDVTAFLQSCIEKLSSESSTEKHTTTNAERCKKYREKKKNMSDDMSNMSNDMSRHVEYVADNKEERDEERESFSPSFPSSLPSSPSDSPINYPITPIIPSSQEKEAEREENVLANVPKAKRDRGELKHFGAFVELSNTECQKLVDKFGKDKVFQMIDNMNNYIGEDPKRVRTYKTRNHYLTLLNWERMDQERKQPKQIPKEKSFRDLRIEMEAEETKKDDVIDSFWRVQ